MKKLTYETVIDRGAKFVFENMFKKEIYTEWWGKSNATFLTYEGDLQKGAEIKFGDGSGDGISGVVSNYLENEIIEFTYETLKMNGELKTLEGGMPETYSFDEIIPDVTLLKVEIHVPDEYAEGLDEIWKKAILILKNTLEGI